MSIVNKLGIALLVLLSGLYFKSALSDEKEAVPPKSRPIISSNQLGGDERHLMYLTLDKPVYRATEPVYIRTTFLNAIDNTPLSNQEADINLQIKGPKGNIVFNTSSVGGDSTVGTKWQIPDGMPGGQYTAVVTSNFIGAPETQRSFEIRAYRAPRLKTQIEFTREGYGPGDRVHANISIKRAEGGIPKDAEITVIARIDGNEVYRKPNFRLTESGVLSTQFKLPNHIETGDGTIAFIIEDGGVIETASKTLPIILQSLSINFYPESGRLVSGLSSRVYIQANRPDGKSADIKGRIFATVGDNLNDSPIAKVATSHEGRGVFSFTPTENTKYVLVLDAPSGIKRHFTLPSTNAEGVIIQSTQNTYAFDDDIIVDLFSNMQASQHTVTLHKRNILLDSKEVEATNELTLDAKDSEGVLIVTAWSDDGIPLAERLIYRQPRFSVNVSLSMDEAQYVPGQEVTVDVVTTNHLGQPIEAVVGLTVTDDTVLEIIEKRDQAPSLPVMVYLESEVNDLADAHIYLDAKNAQAPLAIDLLLGTQGWRRFILVDYLTLKQDNPEAARRALAERNQTIRYDHDNFVLEEVLVEARRDGNRKRLFKNEIPQAVPVAKVKTKAKAQAQKDVNVIAEPAPVMAKSEVSRPFKLLAADAELNAVADIIRERPTRIIIREYAHQVRPNRKANDRVDFTETLYWHKGIRTSARDGKASFKFGLSDSVTSFKITGDAFGRNGALGTTVTIISSVEPFYIEPKMPLEASVGDVIELPVALVNASPNHIDSATLLVKATGLSIIQAESSAIRAGQRGRSKVRIVANKPGVYPIVFSAAAGPYADRVTRLLTVKANGFPVSFNQGGLLSAGQRFHTEIEIPKGIEFGSLKTIAKVYPSPLANMEEALSALLRQPNGCFEQTSSTNYPLVMAQQYFTSHEGVAPEKIAKAKALLKKGYKKLIGFESKDSGYEWFGANPAHEALTAYGLMEFVDMAKVMQIDDAMIERTRAWLLERRDGEGGFKRNEKSLDSFGSAPRPTTNAYIVWSLLESGEQPATLTKEIDAIRLQALKTDDSYVIALAANIMHFAGDSKTAKELSLKLVTATDKLGAVQGAKTSITRSGGDSLTIETTSLAILAWLKNDQQWAAQVEVSMKWLFERSQSGRFGSTQSTILALKAINTYDAARAKPKKAGSVRLLVNGQPFGHPVSFDQNSKGAMELPDFAAKLAPGKHTLELEMKDGVKMPFAIEITYNTTLPVNSSESELEIETRLSSNNIAEGEPLEMQVNIKVADNIAPTPIAIIGIPAGLEVAHEQLKELVASDRISSYEVNGRELVLYWRALAANRTQSIPIRLIASVPGQYVGPASRTYLYYTDQYKHWVSGERVTVVAKN